MQTDTLSVALSRVSSGPALKEPTSHKFFGFESVKPEFSLERTINNYLKTPAEMDAEFVLEMSNRNTWQQEPYIFEVYGTTVYKDRNINAYSPDDTPSGFMEENY